MAVNTQPVFPVAPTIGIATAIATNTSRSNIAGTGTTTAVTPTSTNGRRIDSITVQAYATTAAAIVMIFLYDGTTQHLYDEFVVPAITPGNTVAAFRMTKYYLDLVLPPTYRLFACTTIAQNTQVFAQGGDL